jgi:hypothetical protein
MRRSFVIVALVTAALGSSAVPANADSTHVFLRQFTLDGRPEPFGVSHGGDLYVYRQEDNTVGKYSPSGQGVDFSSLGENTIDGIGGHNCPAVPSDCDAVPTNGFNGGSEPYRFYANMAALDTSGGPADGYIYVANPLVDFNGHGLTQVEVFDETGKFRGEIDQTQAEPLSCFFEPCRPFGISVNSNGDLFISYEGEGIGAKGSRVDEYVPVDGNPAHDKFVGQLHAGGTVTAGADYVYLHIGHEWHQYAMAEFHDKGSAKPVSFGESSSPFHEYGAEPPSVGHEGYNYGAVDPLTQDFYMVSAGDSIRYGRVVEFGADNEQIGPPIGNLHIGDAVSLAIDRSGGPNEGNIYVPGNTSNTISVYSPPVPAPDVELDSPAGGHTTATVGATVKLAGGPEVTECRIDFGPEPEINFFLDEPIYKVTAPCSPSPPYGGTTHVTGNLTGLSPSTEYHYRIVVRTENGQSKLTDHTFHTVAVLGVETGAPNGITMSTAQLTGSANPDGMETEYYFEYGPDKNYGARTPIASLGTGTEEQAVPPVEVSKLQSGRTYHVRLVATNNLGTTYGQDRAFRVAREPSIAGVRTTELSSSSATLNARIDTVGYDTTYRFEYGTSAAYGASVPVPDGQLTGSSSIQDVTQSLSNLDPGNTYHYRVVATNKWGTAVGDDISFNFAPENCPNSLARQQTGANYLPDCRAYELVSPASAGDLVLFAGDELPNARRGGLDIVGPPKNTGQATDPARFGFYGALGSAPGTLAPNTLVDFYVSTRSNQGWVTKYPGISGNEALLVIDPHCSATLGQCYDYHLADLTGGDPFDVGSGIPYLWNADGTFAGRLPTNASSIPGSDKIVGDALGSATFAHYAFSSKTVRFTPEGLITAPGSAYDNDTAAKTVTLISKRPDGSAIPQEPSNTKDHAEYIRIPMVSKDGSHILMSTANGPACQLSDESCIPPLTHLYMRVEDSVTYDVSGGKDVRYLGATSDGTKVFFASSDQLSNDDSDSSVDLYMWQQSDNSITLLSRGNGQGNSDSCTATWTTQCDVQPILSTHPEVDSSIASEGGDVYFYSPESLDSANPGIPDQRNLYVYRGGQVQYVTTLDPGTELSRFQVTPDGRHAAFVTDSRLTSYDNAGYAEMYAFDASSGDVECVSCAPDGSAPTADAAGSTSGLFITDDGRTFFSTPDPLVSADTNGLIDIYEFVGGRPQLISSGTASEDTVGGGLILYPPSTVGLEAVSANGTDVYFSTFDTLVSEDHNGPFFKFYDARTNGGFLLKEPTPPCTAADECHGPSSTAPADPEIGTRSALGTHGNFHPKTVKRRHKHRRRRRHSRRKHHG